MLTARLVLPWRLGVEAQFPFHDLARLLAALSPTNLDLLFVALPGQASELQLCIQFAPSGAGSGVLQLRRALLVLEGESDFECCFGAPDQALELAAGFDFLSVQPDVLALPSDKEFSLLVPLLDVAWGFLTQARLQGLSMAYRLNLLPRPADPVAARHMVPALAELDERAPHGATLREAQRAFDALRVPGWTAFESIGIAHVDAARHQALMESLLLRELAARYRFVPPELWLLKWNAKGEVDLPQPAACCRDSSYLEEVFARITPHAPARASVPIDRIAARLPLASDASPAEPYVFVSYAHKDQAVVHELRRRLDAVGLRFKYDAGIEPGAVWDDSLEQCISGAHIFIACVSDAYAASRYCKRELKFADLLSKPIVPVSAALWAWTPGLRMMFQELQVHPLDSDHAWSRLHSRLAALAPSVFCAPAAE